MCSSPLRKLQPLPSRLVWRRYRPHMLQASSALASVQVVSCTATTWGCCGSYSAWGWSSKEGWRWVALEAGWVQAEASAAGRR